MTAGNTFYNFFPRVSTVIWSRYPRENSRAAIQGSNQGYLPWIQGIFYEVNHLFIDLNHWPRFRFEVNEPSFTWIEVNDPSQRRNRFRWPDCWPDYWPDRFSLTWLLTWGKRSGQRSGKRSGQRKRFRCWPESLTLIQVNDESFTSTLNRGQRFRSTKRSLTS